MRRTSAFRMQAAILGGLCLHLGSATAVASGFSIPEASALGTAMSNAVVANPEETGAFAYNPAAMGFHDRTSVSLGTLFIGPSFSVDYKTDSAQLDSQLSSMSGDGDGWGWNTSVLYRRGALSLGAVYHSSSTSELRWRISGGKSTAPTRSTAIMKAMPTCSRWS